MTRRPGLSLTEVLVALFIMGIGTIAILTLFPLGALNMAQAFRDDRTTQAAGQADAFLRWYVQDKKDNNKLRGPTGELFVPPLDDPGSTTHSKYLIPVTGQATPSYPVVIDPMGFNARGGTDNSAPGTSRIHWVGDGGFGNGASPANSTALARRSLKMVTDRTASAADVALQRPLALRLCTLLDGFGYDKGSGTPDTNADTAPIDRDIRYNWLWVIQKDDNSKSAAKMTVVVFDKRAPGYAPAGSETVYTPAAAQPGLSLVSFSGTIPPVQKGGWLMDCTVVAADDTGTRFFVPSLADGGGPPPANTRQWVRNAHFYRVVSVTETSTTSIDVELESPLRDDVIQPAPPVGALVPLPKDYRRFIYLTGVAEVFVRQVDLDL